MARTQLNARQLKDGDIQNVDMDIITPGLAVVTKLVAGTGVTFDSTGVDEGTGVVTINATNSVFGKNVDGGHPASVYLPSQNLNGGTP
jgi:hypothetical protein